MKTLIVLSAAAFLFCALSAAPTAAMTVLIMPDGSGDAPTVQVGLDMCAAGDTVLVAAGTYHENIVWPDLQSIVLKSVSEMEPELTVLDGGGIGSVISITTNVTATTIISGFTIRNGESYLGGGIFTGNASPTIRHNTITENTASDAGGGVGCSGGSPIIEGNMITLNNTTGGGGIGYSDGSTPKITGNTISNNSAYTGGGILVWDDCGGEITDNIIRDNKATHSGGGITSQNGVARIADNAIYGNSAIAQGGGILCNLSDQSTIIGNVITNNSCLGGVGAGIDCDDDSTPTIEHCEITSNQGHGVHCAPAAYPAINFNNIYGNSGYGVLKSGPVEDRVDASYNWWGDPSGPFHPVSNPSGLGDDISDHVAFEPWYTSAVGVENESVPRAKNLIQNHPNPFNPQTIIAFELPDQQTVSLRVFDVAGRLVRVLADGEVYPIGNNEAVWNGKNDSGRQLASGTYIVRLETESGVEARKVSLIR